jgi:hypothetical protein
MRIVLTEVQSDIERLLEQNQCHISLMTDSDKDNYRVVVYVNSYFDKLS